ncbi:MAG: LacI family DNA-binding transcriptional regulator [Paracoccaceae bacterium]|nr:LacI family DNA-binding transcriptional regulator [Paracoccaceae bacterium]
MTKRPEAKRPGLADLAQEAGVSLATVDRVLNGREAVRPETAARVAEAAARLGHPAAAWLVPTALALPELRFGVVLHKGAQEFYRDFAAGLAMAVAQAQGVRGRLVLEYATSQSPAEVAALMRAMAGRCDVLAATAVNHPEITAAVSAIQGQGLPVFALLSDFAQGVREGYLGVNNLKVGRVAGWMLSLAAQASGRGTAKVAAFVGGHRWQGHELREAGFRAYLREVAPGLTVLDTLVNLETRALTHEATLALLDRHPDLCGLYVAGGGMEGAITALREMRHPGEVALVVHELTSDSRAGLAEGWVNLVVATPLPRLCRDLVAQMIRAAQQGAGAVAAQHFLTPDLHLAESI